MNEHWPASFDTMIDRLTGVLEINGRLLSRDEVHQIAVDDTGSFLLAYGEFHDLLVKEKSMAQTKDYRINVNNGRRWLALNKQADGTYQLKVMLGDNEKPLATLPFDESEWKKLANYSAGLLKK